MADASSRASNESCPIFEMWLSQWRLATLDCDSAPSVLAFVLNAMRTRPGQNIFWHYLEQFFSPSTIDDKQLLGTSTLDSTDIDRLVQRAILLPPRRAKLLLEHVGRNYSLSGEHLAFWRYVEQAFKLDANSHREQGIKEPTAKLV